MEVGMRAGFRMLILDLVFVLVAGQRSFAGPVRPVNLVDVVNSSDVIAVGVVTGIEELRANVRMPGDRPRGDEHLFAANITVAHVLRGQSGPSLVTQFVVPNGLSRPSGLQPGRPQLLFIRRVGAHFEFTDIDLPALPLESLSASSEVAASEPIDRVLSLIRAFLHSRNGRFNDKVSTLHLLSGTPTDNVRSVLREMLQNPDANIQVHTAVVLLRVNDVAGLGLAEDALLRRRFDVSEELMSLLRGAVAEGLKDPAAVPTLGRLMTSPEAETRRVAAMALRRVRSATAIPLLLNALSDAELDVQYSAVMGLAEVTGAMPYPPSKPKFLQDPALFVTFWREWAARRF